MNLAQLMLAALLPGNFSIVTQAVRLAAAPTAA